MHNTKTKKFKGEVDHYLQKQRHNFDSKIDDVFSTLGIKTCLSISRITKAAGFHPSHILFALVMMPILNIKTVHSYCRRIWDRWLKTGKDTFYRFKENPYNWRTFLNQVNKHIFSSINLEKSPKNETYFVLDDTITEKRGKRIENVSFVRDHNLQRNVNGFCIVLLGLLTQNGFYALDFAYRFGKKRYLKSPERIGDKKTASGQRSFEAKYKTKPQLALMMIENAVKRGITAGYVLFDSWYASPVFINNIRKIAAGAIHVICRLKNNNTKYLYNGTPYNLSELYKKAKPHFKKDKKTGLKLYRINAFLPKSKQGITIVFSKGYREPDESDVKGKKKEKKPNWTAFLSTDTSLHASTIIKKYTRRWSIEVCFKECKQMLGLGKEQCNNFNGQVFAATASFFRYNLLNYLNEKENYDTLGMLFEHLIDEAAVITYSKRLWLFFKELFRVSIKAIFDLFDIDADFNTFSDALNSTLNGFTPFQGCET